MTRTTSLSRRAACAADNHGDEALCRDFAGARLE